MFRFEDYFGPVDTPMAYAGSESLGDGSDPSASAFSSESSHAKGRSTGSRRTGQSSSNVLFRYRLIPSVGFNQVSDDMIRSSGYTAEEFYANPDLLERMTDPVDRPRLIALLNASGGGVQPVVVRLQGRRGATLSVELSRRRIGDEGGHTVAVEVLGRPSSSVPSGQLPERERDIQLRAMFLLCQDPLGILRSVQSPSGEITDFVWELVNEPLEILLGAEAGSLAGSTVSDSIGDPVSRTLIRLLSECMSGIERDEPGQARPVGAGLTARTIRQDDSVMLHLKREPETTTAKRVETIENAIDATLDEDRTITERLEILCDMLVDTGADFAMVLLNQVSRDEPITILKSKSEFPDRPALERAIERWCDPHASDGVTGETSESSPEVEVLTYPDQESAERTAGESVLTEIQQAEPSSVHVTPIPGTDRDLGMIVFGTGKGTLPLDDRKIRVAQLLIRPISFKLENSELRDEVRSTALVREEFMSLVAHEIKTPLTGIQGYGQLLERYLTRQEPDLDRARRAIDGLRTQIERFRILANDLLDATRVHQGRLDLRLERTSLHAIAQSAADRVLALEPADGRDILVDFDYPILGVWDAARIDQVLYILLSNAVNYSVDGEIRLTARLADDHAVISVVDHGVGIRQEDINVIFQPFGRGRRAHGLSAGSGLGLYLAREIVRRHGGQISLRSQLHAGTTVTIRLPLNPRATGIDPGSPLS